MELGIVGVGSIAEAIVDGLGRGTIHLSPHNAARARQLAARHATVHVAERNQAVVDRAAVVLVCVRPQDAEAVLGELAFRPGQTVISVMAGVPLAVLRPRVHPADGVVRALPLPAVARRAGVTAILPDDAHARALFEPLGGVLAVDDERALDSLFAATATIASHLTALATISDWLARRGIRRAEATRYVAALFAGLSLDTDDFGALAAEHATRGGINEQLLATLQREGVFAAMARALDDVGRRLDGEPLKFDPGSAEDWDEIRVSDD